MTISHNAATRTALANAVLGQIDAGAGAGKLVFRTAADAVVATLPLTDPAGVVAGAVLTFNAITSDTNAAGGVITNFTIEDDAAVGTNRVLAGTANSTDGDILLSSDSIGAGDTVQASSLSYTAAV